MERMTSFARNKIFFANLYYDIPIENFFKDIEELASLFPKELNFFLIDQTISFSVMQFEETTGRRSPIGDLSDVSADSSFLLSVCDEMQHLIFKARKSSQGWIVEYSDMSVEQFAYIVKRLKRENLISGPFNSTVQHLLTECSV